MKSYILVLLMTLPFMLVGQIECTVIGDPPADANRMCDIDNLTIEDVRVFPQMETKVVFHFEENSSGFNFDDAFPSSSWTLKNGYDFASGLLGVLNSDSRIIDNYVHSFSSLLLLKTKL